MKKALSFILAMVMCLALIPMTAYAAEQVTLSLDKTNYGPQERMTLTVSGVTAQMAKDGGRLEVYKGNTAVSWGGFDLKEGTFTDTMAAPIDNGNYEIRLKNDKNWDQILATVTFTVGTAAKDGIISLDKKAYTAHEQINVSFSGITQEMVNSEAIVAIYKKNAKHDEIIEYRKVTLGSGTTHILARNENGEFEMRLYTALTVNNDETLVMSVPFTVSGATTASGWAQDTVAQAQALGLIPDTLKGADLTKPINRGEFAAVCVKVYENLKGTKTTPAAVNPFKDSKDTEVLKAYNFKLMIGISADEFAPDVILNRETMATGLTNVLKRAYLPEGSELKFNMPQKFADDDKISGWARDSVYFMVANGVISGMGSNMFQPRATTSAEQAVGYANATREQALTIAVKIVDNLKDKPIDYK